MIQYINRLPSKIEYFEMACSAYGEENVEVSELSKELDQTITAICAYNGDRMVGMGRVKAENGMLCITDLIVKLEPLKEEIQNHMIINLITEINKMKRYDVNIRECLHYEEENQFLEPVNSNQYAGA